MTRKLCIEYVDPYTIEPLLANRFIPLYKGAGQIRPIGVGEVLRRITAKCVTKVLKQDVIEASGPLQLCEGHKGGSEAGIHVVNNIFEADETDAVLLIDATNAFNSLNRTAALHNIRIVCPSLATYAINTFRVPACSPVCDWRKRTAVCRGNHTRRPPGNEFLRYKFATLNHALRGVQLCEAVLVR